MTKASIQYSSLWSDDFTDDLFVRGLRNWLKKGRVTHDTSHAKPYHYAKVPATAAYIGKKFAREFRSKKHIMGIFDEGCMGMFNAIIPDELLHPTGIFKERLRQSALYAKMRTVSDAEARQVLNWL